MAARQVETMGVTFAHRHPRRHPRRHPHRQSPSPRYDDVQALNSCRATCKHIGRCSAGSVRATIGFNIWWSIYFVIKKVVTLVESQLPNVAIELLTNCYGKQCDAMWCRAMRCHACDVMWCYVMFCVMLCAALYVMLCDAICGVIWCNVT